MRPRICSEKRAHFMTLCVSSQEIFPKLNCYQQVADYFEVSTDQLLYEPTEKKSKPGPKSKIEAQLEAIRKLPSKKQKTVSEMLDMVLT